MTSATRTVPVHTQAAASRSAQPLAMHPHTPSSRELHPGPKNRLFLSLRSGIDDQVDWALPRLVLASFDRPELFTLESWIDSVTALREWPDRWLDDLEREAAHKELLREPAASEPSSSVALGSVPEFTRNPVVEARANLSLQIIRNASFAPVNARLLARTSFVDFVLRFFGLPLEFVLDVALRSPEIVQHLIVILQSVYQYLPETSTAVIRLLTEVLPTLATKTRDMGILTLVLPVLIMTFQSPTYPPPPPGFIQHLLYLITLSPPAKLLDLVLDLLAAMVPQPAYARMILCDPCFPAHLKQLAILLDHGASASEMSIAPPPATRANKAVNPASTTTFARQGALRRRAERDADQKRMEMFGGPGVHREVGDKAPELSEAIKRELYIMTEPKRSIAWMHETFVYSSHAQLLQVTFWHAYRDFFSHSSTVEQLLSASEVIKNVAVAFPAAQAKLWQDESGERKFVIAGLGFRKGGPEVDRFVCVWRGCTSPTGYQNPGELLNHVEKQHLAIPVPSCAWGHCNHSPFTLTHLFTHLPLVTPPDLPESLPLSVSLPPDALFRPIQTQRTPALLPQTEFIRLVGKATPTDTQRIPTGTAFLSALVIRGLARNLRTEIMAGRPAVEVGLSDEQRRAKKKHLAEDRFGLPIPASVLREEEEEEDAARGDAESAMGADERDRARGAFSSIEAKLLEVVNENFTGLGMYLGEAFGW